MTIPLQFRSGAADSTDPRRWLDRCVRYLREQFAFETLCGVEQRTNAN